MGALRKAIVLAGGTVSPFVQRAAAADIDAMIRRCLTEAAARWADDGFPSFDHVEASQTVQLYARVEKATHDVAALRTLTVQLESVELTPEVLAGRASAVKLPRPDLRFRIGRASRLVECKRLADAEGLPKKYVDEGMMRFVSGKYAGDSDHASMVGYIHAGEEAIVASAINAQALAHPYMGPSHLLSPASSPAPLITVRESHHLRTQHPSITLDHLLIDIR